MVHRVRPVPRYRAVAKAIKPSVPSVHGTISDGDLVLVQDPVGRAGPLRVHMPNRTHYGWTLNRRTPPLRWSTACHQRGVLVQYVDEMMSELPLCTTCAVALFATCTSTNGTSVTVHVSAAA